MAPPRSEAATAIRKTPSIPILIAIPSAHATMVLTNNYESFFTCFNKIFFFFSVRALQRHSDRGQRKHEQALQR